MKILVLDNYDSFTYNLVYKLYELGLQEYVSVYRNDKIRCEEIEEYDKILLSPGPGIPCEAGIMTQLLKTYCETKSILGVCLGHQAIAENFGGELLQMKEVLHGINTPLYITHSDPLFSELPLTWNVCHYHSWTVNPMQLPTSVIPTSTDGDHNILSLSHKTLRVKGVQFHPESYFTEHGKTIIKNWIEKC